MSIISPADLEASPLADLHALASALGIDGFRRLRKPDLVDAILARQGAAPAPRTRAAPRLGAPAVEEAADARRGGDEPASDAEERPPRAGRRRRRRGRGRDGEGSAEPSAGERDDDAAAEPERVAEGVVELLPNGSGFLRVRADETSDDDVYISAAQARRCELVSGDRISGPVRPARRSERHPRSSASTRSTGCRPTRRSSARGIEDLEVDFPTVAIALGTTPRSRRSPPRRRSASARASSIGGPARSGRSELLRQIGAAIAAADGLEVELLAVGVRPEELSAWKEVPHATASGLTFAASADVQEAAIEQAAERGRRIAVRGGNAVLLIDTLDGIGAPAAASYDGRRSQSPDRRLAHGHRDGAYAVRR